MARGTPHAHASLRPSFPSPSVHHFSFFSLIGSHRLPRSMTRAHGALAFPALISPYGPRRSHLSTPLTSMGVCPLTLHIHSICAPFSYWREGPRKARQTRNRGELC